MENLPQTSTPSSEQPASSELPTATIQTPAQQPTAPISQKKSPVVTISFVAILLIGFGLGIWYLNTAGKLGFGPANTVLPTMIPVEEPLPSTEPPTSTSNSFSNNALLGGLQYSLPTGWTTEKINLAEGESIQKYPVKLKYTNEMGEEIDGTFHVLYYESPKGGGELTILSKDGMHLGIFSQTTFEGDCGWEARYGDEEFNTEIYRSLTVLGQEAVRPNLENGYIRIMPEYYGDPRAQYVQGKTVSKDENGVNIYTLPFCIEDDAKKVRLDISYMSQAFVAENFDAQAKTAKNIDPAILAEMDGIVESIKFQ